MPTKAMIQEIQCWIDQFNPDYLSLKTLADKMAFQAGMLDRAAEQDAQDIGLLVSPNH
jgi:hypothetical protein